MCFFPAYLTIKVAIIQIVRILTNVKVVLSFFFLFFLKSEIRLDAATRGDTFARPFSRKSFPVRSLLFQFFVFSATERRMRHSNVSIILFLSPDLWFGLFWHGRRFVVRSILAWPAGRPAFGSFNYLFN